MRVLLLVSAAGLVAARHQQSHLRTAHHAPLHDMEAAKMRNVISAFSHDMGSLYMFKGEDDDTTGAGAGAGVLQAPQGMSIPLQEPEDHIKPLMEKLSDKCGTRFEETLHGKAKGMHNLNLGSKTLKSECESDFEGKLCGTKAVIHTDSKDPATSNKVAAEFTMDGDSCIPKECVRSSDLAALAEFMRGRAETMGREMGSELEVTLMVDCGEHPKGGSIQAPQKSKAATVVPLFGILLAALIQVFH